MATLRAVIFGAQAHALALQARVDNRLGYPIAGTDGGGGIHVPPALSVTNHHAAVYKHPTLSQWAFIIEGIGRPHFAAIQAAAQARITGGNPLPSDPEIVAATEQDVDGTWGV